MWDRQREREGERGEREREGEMKEAKRERGERERGREFVLWIFNLMVHIFQTQG